MFRFVCACVFLFAVACGGSHSPETTTPSKGKKAQAKTTGEAPDGLLQEEEGNWRNLISTLEAPCEKKQSLLECTENKSKDNSKECSRRCEQASHYLTRLVTSDYPAENIGDLYRLRFDPRAKVEFDLSSTPVKGPNDAAVTIVAYSDFECPYCALAASVLEQIAEHYKGQVRIAHKHFPLPQHAMAVPAAKAAIAAYKQDKFWEMHDKLFENQRDLSEKSIIALAKEAGLNMKSFNSDWKSEQVQTELDEDISQAKEFGLRGTPTLFINGRLYAEPFEALPSYLEEEIALQKQ